MMNKLLIVLGYCVDDAPTAEALLDWIYVLNGKQKVGHLLLSCHDDVHAEMRTKVSISAEMAFENVTQIVPKALVGPHNKVERINALFKDTAAHVQAHCQWPFLWMEPDAAPVKSQWIRDLSIAYDMQPMRYMGTILKPSKESEDRLLSRVAIYPRNASSDLANAFNGPIPFNLVAGSKIVQSAVKTHLIQHGSWKSGDAADKLTSESVLFHSDKTGRLLPLLRGAFTGSSHRITTTK